MSTESDIDSKYIRTELDKISKKILTKQYKISNASSTDVVIFSTCERFSKS